MLHFWGCKNKPVRFRQDIVEAEMPSPEGQTDLEASILASTL